MAVGRRVSRCGYRPDAGEPNANPSAGIAFFDLDPPKLRILARVVELHSEAAAAAAAG